MLLRIHLVHVAQEILNQMHFKSNLRLITLGQYQYTKSLNKTNYSESDAEYLTHFSKN
jgi:hypothetical protein